MKKQILNISLLICFILAAGCNRLQSEKKEKKPLRPETGTDVGIGDRQSVDFAVNGIMNYGEYCKLNNVFLPMAFVISDSDIVRGLGLDDSVIAQCKFKYMRGYIGINGEGGAEVAKSGSPDFTLFLTPVDANMNDTLLSKNGSKYIFNLVAPCPNTCGYKINPLNLAFFAGYAEAAMTGF